MKRNICILINILLLCGCSVQHKDVSMMQVKQQTIMVDGKLYVSTGKESQARGRCGVMEGEITDSVEEYELPLTDDTSNFGTGYGYQYADGCIEVYCDNKWIVFEEQDM